ncbi:MAG TPA: ABC transporter ATP-binding protein [Candidatus Aminicenantes bacterium]|nr:ABC transporter ATP-binding protein [Candidatus Aminicenantes bacterium]
MIEISDVSKSYNRGEVRAVDHLDLTVPPGEIFGFLGPNGAGKTTTIKMMVGLLKADSGAIRINGLDTRTHALDCKAQISYVPENPATYDRLSGREYLEFMGDVYGVSRERRREIVTRWLEIFGLEKALNSQIRTYSHGMRQKIILLGALLPDTRVFILDEPMVGLDPRSAHHLKEIMRNHCDTGGTLFFSTHVMEVAERICDRIGIIHEGRLVACGSMEELRRKSRDSASLENIFLELTES